MHCTLIYLAQGIPLQRMPLLASVVSLGIVMGYPIDPPARGWDWVGHPWQRLEELVSDPGTGSIFFLSSASSPFEVAEVSLNGLYRLSSTILLLDVFRQVSDLTWCHVRVRIDFNRRARGSDVVVVCRGGFCSIPWPH